MKQEAIYIENSKRLERLNSFLNNGWTVVDMATDVWGGMVVIIQKAIARSPN